MSNYEYEQIPIGVNLKNDNYNKSKPESELLEKGLKNVNSIIVKKPGNKSFYSNKSNENKNDMILIKDQSAKIMTREEELAELERYEEEQRKLFQDAVLEFRNRNNENNLSKINQLESNSKIDNNNKINKKVKFNLEKESTNNKIETFSNPDKFLYSVANNDNSKDSSDLFDFGKVLNQENDDYKYNNFQLASIEEKDAENLQEGDMNELPSNDKSSVEVNKNLLPLYSKKVPCFTCYKFVEIKDSNQEFEYSSSNGIFCSDECERTFIDENIVSSIIFYFINFRKFVVVVLKDLLSIKVYIIPILRFSIVQ